MAAILMDAHVFRVSCSVDNSGLNVDLDPIMTRVIALFLNVNVMEHVPVSGVGFSKRKRL